MVSHIFKVDVESYFLVAALVLAAITTVTEVLVVIWWLYQMRPEVKVVIWGQLWWDQTWFNHNAHLIFWGQLCLEKKKLCLDQTPSTGVHGLSCAPPFAFPFTKEERKLKKEERKLKKEEWKKSSASHRLWQVGVGEMSILTYVVAISLLNVVHLVFAVLIADVAGQK